MMLLRKSATRVMLSRRMMSSTQFVSRHIGPTAQDQDVMLKSLGFSSMRDLIDATVPESIRVRDPLKLPMGLSEHDALKTISDIGSKNIIPGTNAIGQGYHGTYTPSVILRNLVENPSWYVVVFMFQLCQKNITRIAHSNTSHSNTSHSNTSHSNTTNTNTGTRRTLRIRQSYLKVVWKCFSIFRP